MPVTSILAKITAQAIVVLAHAVTAVRSIWTHAGPAPVKRIYFANHTSNGDFVLIWTALPPALRKKTRPVAAADYWKTNPLRRFIGTQVFNAVLIDRIAETRRKNPVDQMVEALDDGSSLIIFPEGTRNTGDDILLEFKSGLYHLAQERPDVELVPVWINNLNHVMPKGEIIPVPLLCTVRFGAAMHLYQEESKADFLARSRAALLALHDEGASA